jgi:prepilin-type N-terminal cleavage/methylation domain-containing protein
MQLAEQLAASNLSTHPKRREKNSPGFTLIEVLMATAILGIGLMGVASLISQASVQDIRAGHVSCGSHLAEEFLENAARTQYSAQAFNALTDTKANTVINGVQFSITCTLADNTPVERCKEMTCTLSWNNSGSPASARYVYVLSPKF